MKTSGLNPLFQVGLDVAGRSCLIVGGGAEAEDKAARLLDAGARLTVVSPRAVPALREWAREHRLTLIQRPFQPPDLDHVFLVVNTVAGDPDLTRQVCSLARRRKILINSYDQPLFSDFGMVALVHPGHLRLSVGTSNASPSLARRLRQDLEKLFDDEFVSYLDQLARVRDRIKAREPDPRKRAALLRSLVADFRLEARLHYPDNWRERLRTLIEDDEAR